MKSVDDDSGSIPVPTGSLLPMVIPSASHWINKGMVPPPQAYKGTPMVAAIKTPHRKFLTANFLVEQLKYFQANNSLAAIEGQPDSHS